MISLNFSFELPDEMGGRMKKERMMTSEDKQQGNGERFIGLPPSNGRKEEQQLY